MSGIQGHINKGLMEGAGFRRSQTNSELVRKAPPCLHGLGTRLLSLGGKPALTHPPLVFHAPVPATQPQQNQQPERGAQQSLSLTDPWEIIIWKTESLGHPGPAKVAAPPRHTPAKRPGTQALLSWEQNSWRRAGGAEGRNF